LLSGAIDYAGLFPPATLQMAEAVRNYAAYRDGDDKWALGRFVLPVQRLDEFVAAWRELPCEDGDTPWSLSAVFAADAESDARQATAFNAEWRDRVRIDAAEARVASAADVHGFAKSMPEDVARFAEVSLSADLTPILRALRATGSAAKLRTGGVIAGAFPAADEVIAFLRACHEAGVRFKATAGLHHAVRGEYRMTYEPESPTAVMFGYLNLLLAAAVVHDGGSDADALTVLTADRSASLELGEDGVRLGEVAVPSGAIAAAREAFVVSFGSCSFREPIDELAQLAGR
jgi:hypothetical protein